MYQSVILRGISQPILRKPRVFDALHNFDGEKKATPLKVLILVKYQFNNQRRNLVHFRRSDRHITSVESEHSGTKFNTPSALFE